MKTGETQTEQQNDPYITRIQPGNNNSTIELEPFIHQVGGRSTILVLGKYICKPINERELAFYESLDQHAPSLKPFVPQFNGTISVNFEESNDGYMVITTNARLQTSSESSNNKNDSRNNSTKDTLSCIDSSDSPYQKFVTKYRIKLVRPINEIIIESHEHDVEQHNQQQKILHDLESTDKQLKRYVQNDKENNKLDTNSNHNINNPNLTTNLNRSRSTSISIPNFEDGNFNQSNDLSSLFDNQLFINEVGKNGYRENNKRKVSSPESNHSGQAATTNISPNSPKVIYNNLSTTKHNPWVLKTFSVLSEFNESMKEQEFILLENLTSDFEYPCIMDLKMGTRLHDDMATQTKIQSHESKVNETTSRALGLRVTGIQVYDKDSDKFICYNKYYGRKLTPESFRSTLKMFVSNENFHNHHKLLERMIERLKQLRCIIVDLDSFRFYTSSLLLIYEGNTCQFNQQSLKIKENNSSNDSSCHMVDNCELCNQDPEKLFDVRVIDFAHSTHANLSRSWTNNVEPQQQSVIFHKGYDEGFIYGLDNLIKILTLFTNE